MAPVFEDRRDPGRVEKPFISKYMTRDAVDAFARRISDRKGLEKYEGTFLKAGRILRDGWRSMEQDMADGDASDAAEIDRLSPKEREDLQRDEDEARQLQNTPLPWKTGFWSSRRRSGLHGDGTGTVGDGRASDMPHNIFWRQPKELRTTIITLCVAAVVQGWNQTATNGANLTWANGLGLTTGDQCDLHGGPKWYFAAVNAVPYLAASVFAVILSDPLNELFFGRRPAICVSALFILASSIGAAFTKTTWQFLLCRVLLGIGMGCKASVVPVFAAEVAPARIRGSLVMNWQLFDTVGIFLGFTANLIFAPLGASSWRAMTASSALPTLVLLALAVVACPESPRFLMSRGHYAAAFETLSRLRGSRLLAAKELLYTHRQLYEEIQISRRDTAVTSISTKSQTERSRELADHVSVSGQSFEEGRPGFWHKLRQLASVRRIRNAAITAFTCMLAQQLCGINVLIFFSSTIFSDATGYRCGSKESARSLAKPLFMSWGLGLINLIFGLPAYWLIDRLGRRWLLLATLPLMTLFMGAASLSYINGPHNVALGVFTYLFTVAYSPGMGPVPFTISAEVFPLDHRIMGMSVAVFTNLFGAGILALFTPIIAASAIGHAGLLGIFTFLNIVTFAMVFFLVRETAGTIDADNPENMVALALEELWRIFDIDMQTFIRYQVKETLPWWWRCATWRVCRPFTSSRIDDEAQRSNEGPGKPVMFHLWAEIQRDDSNAGSIHFHSGTKET